MFWFEDPNLELSWDTIVDDVLDDNDIALITNYVESNKHAMINGEITAEENPNNVAYRSSNIMWLADPRSIETIYDKIIKAALAANDRHFKYSLSYLEPLQYSEYHADTKGHYGLHVDNMLRNPRGHNRKVSFSILLNDRSEFEGGDLCYHYCDAEVKADAKKGRMILFPSYLPHSVSTITKGTRKALVGWINGPNFV